MHKEEVDRGLAEYQPVGQSGAYLSTAVAPISASNFNSELNYQTSASSYASNNQLAIPNINYAAAPVIRRDPKPLRHIDPSLSVKDFIGKGKVRINNICNTICNFHN
jgi:hypothetical protein